MDEHLADTGCTGVFANMLVQGVFEVHVFGRGIDENNSLPFFVITVPAFLSPLLHSARFHLFSLFHPVAFHFSSVIGMEMTHRERPSESESEIERAKRGRKSEKKRGSQSTGNHEEDRVEGSGV